MILEKGKPTMQQQPYQQQPFYYPPPQQHPLPPSGYTVMPQRNYNNKGLGIGLFIMGFFLKLFGFLTLFIGIGFIFLFMGAAVDVVAFILLCLL